MQTRAVMGLGIVAVLGYLRMRGARDAVQPVFTASLVSARSAPSIATARPTRALPDRPVLAPEAPQLDDVELPSLQIGPTLDLPPRTLYGRLVDENGEPWVGATLVATSHDLARGEMVVVTDENGDYRISEVPPGSCAITIYYNGQIFAHEVRIDSHAPTHYDDALVNGVAPEQIAPERGVTITTDYTKEIPSGRTFGAILAAVAYDQFDPYGTTGEYQNIPVGRTFEVVMGAAAGEQIDSYGAPVDPDPSTSDMALEASGDN